MKKIITLFTVLLISSVSFAQSPQKMSYQAVVRNASNALVTNALVGMRISILQGSSSGISVYTETQTPTTNANGLASIEIGSGIVVTGIFANIDWSNGPYFIKTETDPAGGTNYTITGTSQLLSVPYALHAAVSDSLSANRTYLYIEKKATLQNVLNNTTTVIINYDTISTNGFTVNNATGVITFTKSGVYIITGHNSFNAASPGRKLIWFNCTSADHPARIACNEMSNDANRISTSVVGYFNAGDTISLGAFQNTGAAVDCPNSTQLFDEIEINIEMLH